MPNHIEDWKLISSHSYYEQYMRHGNSLEGLGSHYLMLPNGSTLFGDEEDGVISPVFSVFVASLD